MDSKDRMSVRLGKGEKYILEQGCKETGLLPATFIRYLLFLYGKERGKGGIPKEYLAKGIQLEEKIKRNQKINK